MHTTIEQGIKFEDLSDSAKDTAMQHYAVHDDYHEPVYEDYTEDGKARGFHIDSIRYSGFWSQGDGASWVGYVVMKDFIAYHIKDEHPLYALSVVLIDLLDEGWVERTARVARSSSWYCHSNTMDVDTAFASWGIFDDVCALNDGPLAGARVAPLISLLEEETNFINDLLELVQDKAREYADAIYEALEEEYESYFEPDNFKELADANDWLFDENGQLV